VHARRKMWAAFVGVAVAATTSTWSKFTEWKRQYGRTYATTAEEVVRFDVWASNRHSLEAACRANPHARFESDGTADWTIDELAGLRGGPLNTTGAEEQPRFDDAAVGDAGPIDWVGLGAVNPPVSQGRCGTCAQFSATADIEAQWFLHGHGLVKLSEQEMIDCGSYTGPYGMGWVSDEHKGLASNRTYPLANHSDPTLRGCRSSCNASAADPARSVAHVS
jgi:cysteine peptidase B